MNLASLSSFASSHSCGFTVLNAPVAGKRKSCIVCVCLFVSLGGDFCCGWAAVPSPYPQSWRGEGFAWVLGFAEDSPSSSAADILNMLYCELRYEQVTEFYICTLVIYIKILYSYPNLYGGYSAIIWWQTCTFVHWWHTGIASGCSVHCMLIYRDRHVLCMWIKLLYEQVSSLNNGCFLVENHHTMVLLLLFVVSLYLFNM